MKDVIRKEILKKRGSMKKEEVICLSKSIYENILKWDSFINAETVMLYCDFRNEVETKRIMEASIDMGKKVVFPKSIRETHTIIPYYVNTIEDLKPGEYGILEPACGIEADKKDVDIVFVPGAVFDRRGNRYGYGAGYYDRFLKNYNGIKAGICYEFQLLDAIKPGEYDISMDCIINEKGILLLKNKQLII